MSIHAKYERMSTARTPYLERGRACAEITLPYLLPSEGSGGETTLPTPFQSVGAQGVNTLAAKIIQALLPPNESFFRFEATAIEMEEAGLTLAEGEVALASMERAVLNEIESKAVRVPVHEAVRHLLVIGNVLLYKTQKGLKLFRLDRYVVRRDAMGNPVSIIVKETIHPSALPDKIKRIIERKRLEEEHFDGSDHHSDHHSERPKSDMSSGREKEELTLYTAVHKTLNGRWELIQEVDGEVIEESHSTFPEDQCPFLPLRLNAVDGECYGRGFIEEYYGDLRSLENLSRALVEASQAAARVLFLVRPNGTTRMRTLQELPNGGIGDGQADDVSCIQLEKQADFSVARQQMETIQQRLEMAFMMGSSIQRKGERVTAEEIRYLANELEQNLGGIYSLLSNTLQRPLVDLFLAQLQRERKLPSVPSGLVKTHIITGLEALGRITELDKLRTFRNELMQSVQLLQEGSNYINPNEFILRIANALGIETNDLVKTEQRTADEQQQQGQQAMTNDIMSKAAPQVATEMAKVAAPEILGSGEQ